MTLLLHLEDVKPLTANDVRRMTWRAHRTAKAVLQQQLDLSGVQLHGRSGWPRLEGPHQVVLQVQPPSRAHHDADGWAPTLKAGLDAVVARGVLRDDCTCHVPGVSIDALPAGSRWVIRLVAIPVDAARGRAEPIAKKCSSTRVTRPFNVAEEKPA